MHSLSVLKYHTGRVDSTVLSTSVQQHLYAESYCPQFIMTTFLIRIMDTDWEVLKVQIKDTCLESCTSSWNIKLLILTLQLYDFGKPCKLWQNKLASLTAEYKASFCNWLIEQNNAWIFRQFGGQGYTVSCSSVHRLKLEEVTQQLSRGMLTRKSQLQFSPSFRTEAVCTEKIYYNVNCFLLSGHLSHSDMCSPPVLPYRYQ